MNLAQLKNLFLKIMIGCLIASGLLAVTTVLTGQFNEVFAKSLFSILLIALHALVSFGYIDITVKKSIKADLTFFHNTTFILIILSFITSIFGTWGLLSGSLVGKLYLTYFILLFAVLHGEVLTKVIGKERTTDLIVYFNYGFMSLVILMLLPVIYLTDAASLGDAYYRFLSAAGIIDAILTMVAIILNKIYLQKNPNIISPLVNNTPAAVAVPENDTVAQKPVHKHGFTIIVIILFGFLLIQLVGSMVLGVIGNRAIQNVNELDKPTSVVTSDSQVVEKPISIKPTTPTVESSYSYESEFSYRFMDYKCRQKIAGTWRKEFIPLDSTNPESTAFSFVPANETDLQEYC